MMHTFTQHKPVCYNSKTNNRIMNQSLYAHFDKASSFECQKASVFNKKDGRKSNCQTC